MARLLLATTDDRQRTALSGNLESAGHDVETVPTPGDLLRLTDPEGIDCVIADLDMVHAEGLDLITYISQVCPGAPIVLLTPRERVAEAAAAMRRGAFFYVLTPPNLEDVFHVIDAALRHADRLNRLREFEQEEVDDLFANSPAMRRVVAMAKKVAPTDATVLLLGESGVGKEVIAETIHRLSKRYDKSFLAVNCSALPATLLESELFGHARGAFTGATSDRRGLFAAANGGTIFLDEIGDMPVDLQSKLLRVLQAGEVRRIGENTLETVDVRIIAATNQDLHALMEAKRFREDLYYRLNVIQITIPPLRERRESIPRLIGHFLARFNREYGKQITDIDAAARYALANYHYPGNVRELENIVEHAVIMADGHAIRLGDLPDALQHVPPQSALPAPPVRGFLERAGVERAAALELGEVLSLAEIERRHIADVLTRCGGNQTQAAELLGISRSTLWRKLKDYGLKGSDGEDEA